jgi:translation elongation factor EF-1beta
MKLELERIYREYCNSDLEGLKDEDEFVDVLLGFVKFRLYVSGGDEHGCMVSMNNVSNFLDEIFLYDNMMSDWGGGYRGDFCYENFEKLKEEVDKSNLEENIKKEILEGYRKENGMDEE